MERRDIERLAKEKAEKSAMEEAMASNVVIWIPLVFVAFVAMFGGAPAWIAVVFFTLGLVAGALSAMITWDGAYKKYYEKYLAEIQNTVKIAAKTNDKQIV